MLKRYRVSANNVINRIISMIFLCGFCWS